MAHFLCAGPRIGKTTVITERIVNLLNKNKKILTLTFSNNASDEIKQKLKKLINDELFNEYIYWYDS